MPDFSEIKAIIFDYGGTLDTGGVHWAYVLWDGFRHAGIPVGEDGFRQAYVFAERRLAAERIILPADNFRQLLLKKTNIETRRLVDTGFWRADETERKAKAAAAADYCYLFAKRTVNESKLTLNALRKRYPLVLVTNFYGNMCSVLKDFGLNCFCAVVESAVVGVRKPDPAIFRRGIEALACPAAQVLVVGDSFEKDILPARAVGCRTVWLKGREWEPKERDTSAADAIITALPQLLCLPGLDKKE